MKSASYCVREGNRLRLGTGRMEKTLELTADGRWIVQSLKNSATGKEYVQRGAALPDEFFVTVNGAYLSGSTGGWSLQEFAECDGPPGEHEVTVTLRRHDLEAARHYVLYPGVPVIQEWTEYKNCSKEEMRLTRPSLYVCRYLWEDRAHLDFSYMTGGANFSGSQILKTVSLSEGFSKDFNSQGDPEVTEVDGQFGNVWHPRLNGTGVWNEFFVLTDREAGEGLFLTFDYQGWWKAGMTNRDRDMALTGWCELLDYPVPAGETVRIAPMAYGVYQGDLDDLGNTIAEYIYTYKWDYTRDRYFNRSSLSIWQAAPLREKVFAMVKAARYIGYERLWVDDFWFDAKGNWNAVFGDDWTEFNRYLKEHSMLFRLWMPPWHADRLSQVWVEHPDWMLDFHGNWYNWTIDLSKEEAYQWVLNMLGEKQKEFGSYDLRVDGDPCNQWGSETFDQADQEGNWNGTLKQSENFYRLYREFKEKNPEAGLDGCSSGGHTLGIESVRYVDQQQITDGWCFHMGGYWTTMILPIDKHQGMNIAGTSRKGSWQAQDYDTAQLNLFCAPCDSMQYPERGFTQQALETKRHHMELFRWLRDQGVYGRWIKVYRPELEHGDKTFVLQRMTWDAEKGLILISADPLNPMHGRSERIFPKGLDPEKRYRIDSQLGGMEPDTKTGAEWMRDGIFLSHVEPGEYLFLNLPVRPGMGVCQKAPCAPSSVHMGMEQWMGNNGVGIHWEKPQDSAEISCYELEKNGEFHTKVSIGTFCFDETGTCADQYRIRSVNLDGETSEWVEAVWEKG